MKHKTKAFIIGVMAVALISSACGNQTPTAENPAQVEVANSETNEQLDIGVQVATPRTTAIERLPTVTTLADNPLPITTTSEGAPIAETTTTSPTTITTPPTTTAPPTTTTTPPPTTTTAPPPTTTTTPPLTTTTAPPTTTTAPPPTTTTTPPLTTTTAPLPTTTTTAPPTTTTTVSSPETQCNEAEVYSPSLAQRGIKGTNGQMLTHNERDTRVLTSRFLTQPWFNWQPAKYEKEIWHLGTISGSDGWGGNDLQQVVRLQGSSAGCIPVCFWTDTNHNAVADLGEFYFNYNTHSTPGIGPAPHHQGRLLRTPTQLFLRGLGYPLHEVPLFSAANYARYSIAQQSNLSLSSEIAGVKVAANGQSCVAYDANGSEIPAPQATPPPYMLAEQNGYGSFRFLDTSYQVDDCHYTDSPSCKMYTYTQADEPGSVRHQILSQSFLGSSPGFVCNQNIQNYQAGLFSLENTMSCHIFPHIHER